MYFPFFEPKVGGKRFAAQPQTIDSEFPQVKKTVAPLDRSTPAASKGALFPTLAAEACAKPGAMADRLRT